MIITIIIFIVVAILFLALFYLFVNEEIFFF